MLTAKDQLTLLKDLLSEHAEDCCGTVAECQQIQRLVRFLIANNKVEDEQVQQILPAIYQYSLQAETSSNLNEHIVANQQQLNGWASSIEDLKYL
ncbi:YtzH-like family protein [Pontibacillus litoralis]|uniref:YtzH-like protein n=1 Tax=Pontibacillus litoralis JSM 072002 TaxID=1385512 RepID=A0A0A5GDG8_9BACI|nr:YtzH-like family protein [Pontibacillus litoralis]KGX89165.1 hypothetical protein N784_02225 [Pontibacillus litoralis JSM 072002]